LVNTTSTFADTQYTSLTSKLITKVKAGLKTEIASIQDDTTKRPNMETQMKDDADPQGMLDALKIMKKFVAIKNDKKAVDATVTTLEE
jgi:hypothetical protein